MRIKIIGLAFAIALLSVIGFAYFGTSGTAEATAHPIVTSECAAPPADGTAADLQSPPGVSDSSKANFLNPIFKSNSQARNGDIGDDHCVFPETGSHGDAGPGTDDEHEGEDGQLPSGEDLPGKGPA